MTGLLLGVLVLGLGMIWLARKQAREWLAWAGAGLLLASLLGSLVWQMQKPPTDLDDATDPMANWLSEHCSGHETLIVHTPDHPLLPVARRSLPGSVLAVVTNTLDMTDSTGNPFAVQEGAVRKATAAHPGRSTLVLLLPTPATFPGWSLTGKRVIVGNGNPAQFDRYPKEVVAAFHPTPPPAQGWTFTTFDR